MQFAVPQFTEVEDKLIGSLTLKQFLVLLAAGGVILFFWSILGPSIIFFALSLPVAIFGVGAALGRYNGRAMFTYIMPFAAYLSAPRVRVFKREASSIPVALSTVRPVNIHAQKKAETGEDLNEPAQSRLKKLAYLLDSKNQEKSDIIVSDNIKSIVVPPKTTNPKSSTVLSRVQSKFSDLAKSSAIKHKTAQPEPLSARLAVPNQVKSAPQSNTPARTQSKKFDPNSLFN